MLLELRYALRRLIASPGFTVTAIVTLALAIAGTTAMVGVVDALLLRPLPFPEPERLMVVNITAPERPDRPATDNVGWSYPKFELMRSVQTAFTDVSAFFGTQFTVRVGDEAVRESGEFIDSRYLTTLGIAPALGRAMLPSENRPSVAAASWVMLSR